MTAKPPNDRPWHEDPIEIDRYLDGELRAEERAARSEAVAGDPELARRIAARESFLARLRGSAAGWQAQVQRGAPVGLEERVRGRLGRRAQPRWFAYAAAAVVLLAVGMFFLPGDEQQEAVAAPPEVLLARQILEAGAPEEGDCKQEGPASPFSFPPVKDGELDVVGCDQSGDAPGARPAVLRGEEQIIGFVAVPEKGTRRSPTVGKTELGDVIVYDVTYGDSRAYLAAPKRFVEKHGDCAACHHRSREGQKNPHYIELRRWVVR